VFSHTVTTNLSYYIVQKHQNHHHFNYIHHHNLKTLMFHSSYIKKRVKFTLEQATKAQRSRGIALLFL
jgi:predicted GIY-YIG superfamily endonuclease